jgi:HlyD family secretion protein
MRRWLKGRRWIWLPAILLLAAGGWWYRRVQAAKANQPFIQTAKVERTNVTLTVSAQGTIQPYEIVDVKSKAAGKVIQMAVEVGDRVKKGQLICRIDPSDVQTVVNQAQADLDAALARVQQAMVNWQMQRQLTPTQLEEARQGLEAARARLRQAESSLAAQERQAQAELRQAEQAVAAAKARYEQAKKQSETQPALTQAAIQQAEAAYQSALENLRQLKEATIPQQKVQAQAAVQQAEAAYRSALENLRQLKEATIPQQKTQAQANYDQAKAQLDNAEKNLQRQRELFEKGFVAKSQLDAAEAQYAAAKATFDAAAEKLRTLEQELSAQLQMAEARVADAKAQLDNARERLRTLDAEHQTALRDAEARVAQAKAQWDAAKANAIQDELRRQEAQAAEAALRQAEAQLEAAKAALLTVEQRRAEVDAARAALAQAEAAYRQALVNAQQVRLREEDVKQARAQVQRALAQLRNARIQLADTVITAPRDGVIVEKLVQEGTVISSSTSAFSQGTTIVRLADMRRIYVDAEVAEADIAQVWVGQKVDVSVDAFPGEVFEGKVIRIDPRTTIEQNVVYVHVLVELDEVDERLKPGMSATCDFLVDRKENVLAVPNEAIKEDEEGKTYVEVLLQANPEPKTERRYVEVGLQGTTLTEVKKGLKEGEVVVTAFVQPQALTQQPPQGGGGRFGGGPMGGMRGLMRR